MHTHSIILSFAYKNGQELPFGGPNSYVTYHQGHRNDKPEGWFYYHKAFWPTEVLQAIYDGTVNKYEYYIYMQLAVQPIWFPLETEPFVTLASSLLDPCNPIYVRDSGRFHIRLSCFRGT